MTAPTAQNTARATQSAAGALALLLGCAALSPMFSSQSWVIPAAGTIAAVAAVGAVLRALRVPIARVVVGQLLVLACLVTAVFTDAGVLGVLPSRAAVDQLHLLLNGAGQQIANKKPPVAVTEQMLLVLLISLGSAAIVVDVLVAGVQAPAMAALVLLGVFAVPTSVSHSLLPWSSFVLGALAVLLLLVSDGGRRAMTAGPGASAAGLRSPIVFGPVVLAVVGALAVGAAATGVGTEGRLPSKGSGSQGVALNPFTELRGELGERSATPLFSVAGMVQPTYLRAVALDQFVNNRGWVVQRLDAGSALGSGLGGQRLVGPAQSVTVRGDHYADRWLPSPGTPVAVRGEGTSLSDYTYDAEAAVLQTSERQSLPAYTVQAVVPGGNAEQLRALGRTPQSQSGVDPRWRQLDGVDPRVRQLATSIAGTAPTTFDAAVALTAYFTNPSSGFSYDLSTGNGTVGGDALVDFLTVTKRGFCEQYASAMAVLLRELGIASRVVLGYTPGTGNARLRTITTDDAHAWVEVFFDGIGWVSFDPTPLTGGRGIVAPYVAQAQAEAPPAPAVPGRAEPVTPTPAAEQPAASSAVTPTATAEAPSAAESPAEQSSGAAVLRVVLLMFLFLVLALLVMLGCAPLAVRNRRRVRRLAAGTPDAAWAELADLALDRDAGIAATETARDAGARLCAAFGLDEDGRAAVEAVVESVELQWYGNQSYAEGGQQERGRQQIRRLRAAWERCAPLRGSQRAFPRSVLGALQRRSSATDSPDRRIDTTESSARH